MRRTDLTWLAAFLLTGVVACGGGGKGGSGPPGGYTYENNGATANGWDPFAPAQDPAPTRTEFPGCSGEGTVTVSEIIDSVLVPICNMAVLCGESMDTPPDEPPTTPGTNMSTRDITTALPAHCEEIYDSIEFDIEQDGFAGICKIFEEISDTLAMFPECNPPIVVPEGLCMGALSACISDVVSMGCNASMSSPPRSCEGVSFEESTSTPVDPVDNCQACRDACGDDTECIVGCYESGACGNQD